MKGVVPLALVALVTLAAAASAQTASAPGKPAASPKPASSDVVKPDPVKDAFLSLPEEDRKAAQEALVWLGDYNGVSDGAFGKRTADAIVTYQKGAGQKADGVLTTESLAALKTAGAKARDAVGFVTFVDTATGVEIGAPLRLMEKHPGAAPISEWLGKGVDLRLDVVSEAPSAANRAGQGLEPLFKSLTADQDGRKIGYKAMKAGAFFVVSGEEGETKFYARFALRPTGFYSGFEFRYPKARTAEFDRVAIAISNTFDPNPTGKTTPGASPSPVAVAAPTPSPSAASGPQLIATALIIAPGQALTALTPAECAKPLVAGAPATFGRLDEGSGLARLDGEFGAGASPTAGAEAVTADAVVLSRAPASDKTVLQASRGDWAQLGAADGSVVASAGASARGAPVFSASGDLIGVIAATKTAPKRFGGVDVAAPHRAIAGAPLLAFVAKGAGGGAALTAPELARRFAQRVLAVTCGA